MHRFKSQAKNKASWPSTYIYIYGYTNWSTLTLSLSDLLIYIYININIYSSSYETEKRETENQQKKMDACRYWWTGDLCLCACFMSTAKASDITHTHRGIYMYVCLPHGTRLVPPPPRALHRPPPRSLSPNDWHALMFLQMRFLPSFSLRVGYSPLLYCASSSLFLNP